ncbi:MAG TPA: citrate synthase/methylcitrate synthase, partial [Devosiaceae bacterium]|nr:citrate synthase/methylcitrate synthase [Devosiaceae bacterium]
MQSGLEDVVAAETVLSDVDGLNGRLIIRGASLDDLAGQRFEAIVTRLFGGFFEGLPDTDGLAAALGDARAKVFANVAAADRQLLQLGPVEAVRALTARLADGDDLPTALDLLAAAAVFTPAVLRLREGKPAIPPDPHLAHSADVLRMLTGAMPAPASAKALDTYLTTVSDHGLNASTFAARVVASTQAGLTSAVLAAISALKGPLHGGAPGPVLDMLDAIGTPEQAEGWLDGALDRGERLMGFGHRVYRVRDPRADALKTAVRTMVAEGAVDPARVKLAEGVEAAALAILKRRKPDRSLDTNVEFYTALLLEALGFPRDAFTAVFAMGRTAGWIAHAREQVLGGRLIRPQSVYVGP